MIEDKDIIYTNGIWTESIFGQLDFPVAVKEGGIGIAEDVHPAKPLAWVFYTLWVFLAFPLSSTDPARS
ncbi:MAG: hypothetical protein ACPL07_00620 [Candidatus Bathyarchaeia archaeon]|jgi:hypothetical protein